MTSTPARCLFAFYFNGSVRELIPIYPLYAVMFTEHGVSPFQLSVLFFIWALNGLLFEVPSGALADRFSRKWLIVASGVLKSLGFCTWYWWQDLPGYALGFILWGSGSTLRSGAWEALLHDLLASWDRKLEFTRHYGRMKALATLGAVIGELGGGILIVHGYSLVLLVSAAVPILASIPFVIFVSDPPRHERCRPGYFSTLRQGIHEAVSNATILYILLATILLLTTFGVYDEFLPPTLAEKGFSLALIAYLCVPILLAQSAGHSLAHRFEYLRLTRVLLLIALSATPLLLIVVFEGIWIPVLAALFFFMFGLSSTLFQGHLQSVIEGDARATITSTVSLGDNVGAMLWFLVFGAMAQFTSMSGAAFGLGLSVMALCAIFIVLGRHWGISRGT